MDQPATGRPDGENQNFGLVNITDDPWPEVTSRWQTITGDAAPRRVLAPGGDRDRRTDCVLEWAATAPPPAPPRPGATRPLVPRPRFACRDGDPRCDTDAVPGQCTIEVLPCAAVPDARLPECAPRAPDAVRVRVGDAALAAALQTSVATVAGGASAAPAACGPAVPAVLALDGRRRARATVRTAATAAGGVDHDVVRLRCEAAP
jgi:hypothetical protein